jgi:hypothetical protein
MPAPVFTRPGLIGAAVLAVIAGTIGFANFSLGSAIVRRETRRTEPTPRSRDCLSSDAGGFCSGALHVRGHLARYRALLLNRRGG